MLILAAIVIGWAVQNASAQGLATDAERSYRDLRKSHDTKSQLLAERWYGAVKLQQWTDATGRFKTTAKYLEHDPDLAWVKLRVIEGSGDQRIVKEVTIPLEKLSKACQSRVRRISVLSEKVAAAIEAEKDAEKSDALDEGHAGEMTASSASAGEQRDGSGGRAAGLAGIDADEVRAEGGPRRPRPARTATRRPSPTATDSTPLPALLPPLPGGAGRFGLAASMPEVPQAVPAERRGR